MLRSDETWHRLREWTYGQAPSERLAAQILLDQGYTDFDPSHPLGGKDGGKDALCRKNGQPWLMAVYFSRGQQSLKAIQTKLQNDLAGVAKNNVMGIAFVTNQELSLSERATLNGLCAPASLELFHLERIATLLDQPRMVQVRQQFLYIDSPSTPPQSGFVLTAGWVSVLQGDIINGCVKLGGHSVPVQQQIRTQAGESIESLLTWQSRIPSQLIGRDTEMADLLQWATRGEAAPRLRLLHGSGGMGKTRLAVELGDHLREGGWGVCLVGSPTHEHAVAQGKVGTLLLIDYPELFPEPLGNLLTWLNSGHWPPGRWRILLLSRDERLAQTIDQIAPGRRDLSLALANLRGKEHAWRLFAAASEQMRAAGAGTEAGRNAELLPYERFVAWLAQDAHHHDPLIILVFALNLQYDPAAIMLGHVAIMQSLVRHEQRRIEKGLTGFTREQQRTLLLLKALAALTGGLRRADIKALRAANLPTDGLSWPTVQDVQESTLWQNGQVPELQPDRLAAYFLHDVVAQTIPDEAGAWLWECLLLGDADVELLRVRLGRLARLAWDHAWQNCTGFGLAEVIVPDASQVERLELVFDTNMALEVPLRKLALEVNRLQLAFCEAEAARDFATAAPRFAARLNNFSGRAAEVGRRAEALAAITRAVKIYEELARQSFASYGPVLASSLNNWSNRLAEMGQRAEALESIGRAVKIHDELARQSFTTYGPDFAFSLTNLSIRLAEAGLCAEALEASGVAVKIYEELARQSFVTYGPNLARSLNNWSCDLGDAGQCAESLVAIERAIKIYEELAQKNFAAYAPVFACSLNNWSNRLAESGQHANALAAIERTVQIREELARQSPAMYEPALASSLVNLARLLPPLEATPRLQRALRLITPYDLPGTTYEELRELIVHDLQAR